MTAIALIFAGAPALTVHPTASALPGGSAITAIVSGLLWFGFGLALVGLAASAIAMAVGKHSANGRLHDRGREGVVASLVAAVLIGGAQALIAFAFDFGAAHIH